MSAHGQAKPRHRKLKIDESYESTDLKTHEQSIGIVSLCCRKTNAGSWQCDITDMA